MSPTLSPPVPLRRGAAALAGLAALTLAGCGADEPTNAPAPSSAPASSSAAAPPSASATPSATPSASSNVGALVDAGELALREVSGATLVSIETENSGESIVWEVQLVTRDGDEQELRVSADGSRITRTSPLDRQDAGDRRENLALVDAAKLDFTDAVEAMPDSVADGTISELNLDDEGSRTVWEADAREPGGQRHEIQIDAGSGDVVRDRT